MFWESFLFVTGCRVVLDLLFGFQFGFDLREYSSMYLKSGGGDIFLVRKLFYFNFEKKDCCFFCIERLDWMSSTIRAFRIVH